MTSNTNEKIELSESTNNNTNSDNQSGNVHIKQQSQRVIQTALIPTTKQSIKRTVKQTAEEKKRNSRHSRNLKGESQET